MTEHRGLEMGVQARQLPDSAWCGRARFEHPGRQRVAEAPGRDLGVDRLAHHALPCDRDESDREVLRCLVDCLRGVRKPTRQVEAVACCEREVEQGIAELV